MNKAQKALVIDALKRAFTPGGGISTIKCELTDAQIETLFGAIVLVAALGPPDLKDWE